MQYNSESLKPYTKIFNETIYSLVLELCFLLCHKGRHFIFRNLKYQYNITHLYEFYLHLSHTIQNITSTLELESYLDGIFYSGSQSANFSI